MLFLRSTEISQLRSPLSASAGTRSSRQPLEVLTIVPTHLYRERDLFRAGTSAYHPRGVRDAFRRHLGTAFAPLPPILEKPFHHQSLFCPASWDVGAGVA